MDEILAKVKKLNDLIDYQENSIVSKIINEKENWQSDFVCFLGWTGVERTYFTI